MNFKESETEKWIGSKIRNIGGLYFKFVSPGNDGVPDRLVILPGGKIVFLELKAKKGRLSEIQQRQIKRIRACGCDCRVIRGMKEAEEFVNEICSA